MATQIRPYVEAEPRRRVQDLHPPFHPLPLVARSWNEVQEDGDLPDVRQDEERLPGALDRKSVV